MIIDGIDFNNPIRKGELDMSLQEEFVPCDKCKEHIKEIISTYEGYIKACHQKIKELSISLSEKNIDKTPSGTNSF